MTGLSFPRCPLQLQAHLQELTKVAVRTHLDEAHSPMHPHAIEAVRQISGDIFAKDEANELFRGAPQPHLLHEPYMSTEGAAGMLGQTLADIARKVDQEAEARGTLESREFEAFRALVGSVYVGSLQKRIEHIENKLDLDSTNNKPGVARSGHQACSGDIAQALVAIAMGEGFEHFSGTSIVVDDSNPPPRGGNGEDASIYRVPARGRRGAFGGGARGASGKADELAEVGGDSSSSRAQQQQLLQQERENLVHASAELRYLSEDAAVLGGGARREGRVKHGVGPEGGEGCFPGLQWLAPHIVGRSIPMELRYRLQSTTARYSRHDVCLPHRPVTMNIISDV